MKIILINKFFYLKGGSERVFFNQAELLRRKGHQVLFFSMQDDNNFPCSESNLFVDNIDYNRPGSIKDAISRSAKILYSFEAKKKLTKLIQSERPEIAHLHNIHHQISPSIIHALKAQGIPVVMTLHDYKMVCPAYTLTRDGLVCERCRGSRFYHCLLKCCTKGSRSKSLVNAIEMYLHHRMLGIYDQVDIFISPSRFLKEKVRAMGFDRDIISLPNPLDSRHYNPQYEPKADPVSFCYFGRLSPEKGIFTLIEAMKGLDADLKIIGEGPLKGELIKKVKAEKNIRVKFLGYKSGDELKMEISNCSAVVVPSEWYENYPYTILESFALGKPVVGSRIGGIPELVKDYKTGLTYSPYDTDDLHSKLEILLRDRYLIQNMGKRARKSVEKDSDPEKHYRELMKIYKMAITRFIHKSG